MDTKYAFYNTSKGYKVVGGTAAQFLKADGSSDNSSYLPTGIPLGASDLNTITTVGLYIQGANGNTPNNNYPEDYSGSLLVYQTTAAGRVQEYTIYHTGTKYTRYSTNGTSWSPWVRILNSIHGDQMMPVNFANAKSGAGFTGDLLNAPIGSYVASVSTTSANRPFTNVGGMISFGSANTNLSVRILGARDNSDNLWFQSGDGTGAWRQLVSREQLTSYVNPTVFKNNIWALDDTGNQRIHVSNNSTSNDFIIKLATVGGYFNIRNTSNANVFRVTDAGLVNAISIDLSSVLNLTNANATIRYANNDIIRASTNNVIFSTPNSSTGGLYFRPQGTGVTTGQVLINSNGQITTSVHGDSSQWSQAYNWGDYKQSGLGTGLETNSVFQSDLLSINTSGFYRFANTATNKPENDNGFIINLSRASNIKTRLLFNDASKEIYYTTGSNDNGWKKFWTSNNFNPADYMNTTHPANGISVTDILNWYSAYNWGNHANAGYLKANAVFDSVSGNGLMMSDDNYGGESGLYDTENDYLVAGKFGEYYKYGSLVDVSGGVIIHAESGNMGYGGVSPLPAGSAYKHYFNGGIRITEGISSESSNAGDDVFAGDGKLLNLKTDIIRSNGDLVLRTYDKYLAGSSNTVSLKYHIINLVLRDGGTLIMSTFESGQDITIMNPSGNNATFIISGTPVNYSIPPKSTAIFKVMKTGEIMVKGLMTDYCAILN